MLHQQNCSQTNKIEQAHMLQVRHLDFNPKKQHIMITAGDDSRIRIWDLKMPNIPLQELPGHQHWAYRVQYNPKYEELVLSSGTDSRVNLWHVALALSGDAKPRRSVLLLYTFCIAPLPFVCIFCMTNGSMRDIVRNICTCIEMKLP
jgi:WD40 repeat protein